ncbi:MAG TPA: PDZ domain-containing protein, partial [Tepidisphaeraceae bacterium]|nr:PDZ domain-containing protein [Tepidisphaeraceae bacterium]
PASTPLLQEMDRETRSLYQEIEPGIVRVQLPETRPADAEVLEKWGASLSPEMRYQLEHEADHSPGMPRVQILPPTRPDDATDAGYVVPKIPTEPAIYPNAVGIVLDTQGHVFLPVWVDRDSLGGKPIPVILGDGVASDAKFVGSDKQTSVTILQVNGASVWPVRLAATRPPDGALVLVFSVRRTMTSLAVWTVGSTQNGVIANVDGTVAGFARRDEFLCASTCLPVVRQLILYGKVNRAFLGVRVVPVGPDDPERLHNPALGEKPGIRIAEVLPDSAADQAGLQEGDLILYLGTDTVDNPATFGAAIAARSGETELTILRGQQQIKVMVDLQPPQN